MKLRSSCLLALCATEVQGAFLSSAARSLACRKLPLASGRLSTLVRISMAPAETSKTWKDLHGFNIALDKLAELSGTGNQNVISRAAECQELWERQLADDSDSKLIPDTVSFNTVLKAWSKCCAALSERNRSLEPFPVDVSHSVPVYTPRDAAERATTLLLRQEGDANAARPDTTSYNIVIG